jgi:hypothetical protein
VAARAIATTSLASVSASVDSGGFWHGHPSRYWPGRSGGYWDAKVARNMARDKRVNRELDDAGWRVLRLWDFEVEAGAEDAARRVIDALDAPGPDRPSPPGPPELQVVLAGEIRGQRRGQHRTAVPRLLRTIRHKRFGSTRLMRLGERKSNGPGRSRTSHAGSTWELHQVALEPVDDPLEAVDPPVGPADREEEV